MAKNIDKLTFEDAVARLEEIVAQMEAAELPLDSVIEKYEEGMKLLAFCGDKLTAAEKKIELLTRGRDGAVRRGVLDADAQPEPEPLPARKTSSEISLF